MALMPATRAKPGPREPSGGSGQETARHSRPSWVSPATAKAPGYMLDYPGPLSLENMTMVLSSRAWRLIEAIHFAPTPPIDSSMTSPYRPLGDFPEPWRRGQRMCGQCVRHVQGKTDSVALSMSEAAWEV